MSPAVITWPKNVPDTAGTILTRLFVVSAMNTSPDESTATPPGAFTVVVDAKPPSPQNAAVPEPAMLMTISDDAAAGAATSSTSKTA
jgi:hypothetical protein